MSDIATPLVFVDPAATDPTYRVCLWAAPGEGKSVAAASAPAPLLVLSADRPSAYLYARKHHGHTPDSMREVRYAGPQSLEQVFTYLSQPDCDIKTVIVDPVSNIVDQLADVAPAGREGGPDYQWINKKVLGFVKSLRRFDVNVVLVAHEKVNDGKNGDGKLYPSLGGPTLINKILAEMDIVAHVERVTRTLSDESEETVWIGQLQPVRNLVCKESTAADLGDRRVADLARWFDVANEALAPADDDVPFTLTAEPDAAADHEPETLPLEDAA